MRALDDVVCNDEVSRKYNNNLLLLKKAMLVQQSISKIFCRDDIKFQSTMMAIF